MKFGFFFHQIIQLSITAEFHEEINVVTVREITVKFDKIGMIHVHLYFDLSDELIDHLVFLFFFEMFDINLSNDLQR